MTSHINRASGIVSNPSFNQIEIKQSKLRRDKSVEVVLRKRDGSSFSVKIEHDSLKRKDDSVRNTTQRLLKELGKVGSRCQKDDKWGSTTYATSLSSSESAKVCSRLISFLNSDGHTQAFEHEAALYGHELKGWIEGFKGPLSSDSLASTVGLPPNTRRDRVLQELERSRGGKLPRCEADIVESVIQRFEQNELPGLRKDYIQRNLSLPKNPGKLEDSVAVSVESLVKNIGELNSAERAQVRDAVVDLWVSHQIRTQALAIGEVVLNLGVNELIFSEKGDPVLPKGVHDRLKTVSEEVLSQVPAETRDSVKGEVERVLQSSAKRAMQTRVRRFIQNAWPKLRQEIRKELGNLQGDKTQLLERVHSELNKLADQGQIRKESIPYLANEYVHANESDFNAAARELGEKWMAAGAGCAKRDIIAALKEILTDPNKSKSKTSKYAAIIAKMTESAKVQAGLEHKGLAAKFNLSDQESLKVLEDYYARLVSKSYRGSSPVRAIESLAGLILKEHSIVDVLALDTRGVPDQALSTVDPYYDFDFDQQLQQAALTRLGIDVKELHRTTKKTIMKLLVSRNGIYKDRIQRKMLDYQIKSLALYRRNPIPQPGRRHIYRTPEARTVAEAVSQALQAKTNTAAAKCYTDCHRRLKEHVESRTGPFSRPASEVFDNYFLDRWTQYATVEAVGSAKDSTLFDLVFSTIPEALGKGQEKGLRGLVKVEELKVWLSKDAISESASANDLAKLVQALRKTDYSEQQRVQRIIITKVHDRVSKRVRQEAKSLAKIGNGDTKLFEHFLLNDLGVRKQLKSAGLYDGTGALIYLHLKALFQTKAGKEMLDKLPMELPKNVLRTIHHLSETGRHATLWNYYDNSVRTRLPLIALRGLGLSEKQCDTFASKYLRSDNEIKDLLISVVDQTHGLTAAQQTRSLPKYQLAIKETGALSQRAQLMSKLRPAVHNVVDLFLQQYSPARMSQAEAAKRTPLLDLLMKELKPADDREKRYIQELALDHYIHKGIKGFFVYRDDQKAQRMISKVVDKTAGGIGAHAVVPGIKNRPRYQLKSLSSAAWTLSKTQNASMKRAILAGLEHDFKGVSSKDINESYGRTYDSYVKERRLALDRIRVEW